MEEGSCAEDRCCGGKPRATCRVQDTIATCRQSSCPSPERNRFLEETTSVDENRRTWKQCERKLLKEQLLTAACLQLDRRPPAGNGNLENDASVDEKQRARFERIRRAIGAQGKLFAAQGTIVASWKTHQGKRLGPYYRVAYRVDGKQKSLYLGVSKWLVAQVRALLSSLQALLREHRMIERLKRQARQAFVASKRHLAHLLHSTLGVVTRGWEFRGAIRAVRERGRLVEQEAYDRRAAEAQRVLRGEPTGTRGVPPTMQGG